MQSDSNGSITALNANLATGVPTPNSFIQLNVSNGLDTGNIQVTGTWVGTLIVQVSLNGKNWVTLNAANSIINASTQAQSATIASAAQGIYRFEVSGVNFVRVTASAWTSGQADIVLAAGPGTGVVTINNPLTLGAGTAAIGTLATPAGTAISVTSAATTNASSQKAGSGNLFEITISNPTATPVYVKLYNKASAPTVGTDVPIVTITAAAASATNKPTDGVLTFAQIGKRFSTGIAMAITGGPLATDTTAAVAGVQVSGTYI